MKLNIDYGQFDQMQLRVVEELIISIRNGLKEAGIEDDDVIREATGNIAFSVAEIIDGSRVMELKGQSVVPFLTFVNERNGDELLIVEGGSWMHEYVFGTVDEVFDAEGDE